MNAEIVHPPIPRRRMPSGGGVIPVRFAMMQYGGRSPECWPSIVVDWMVLSAFLLPIFPDISYTAHFFFSFASQLMFIDCLC